MEYESTKPCVFVLVELENGILFCIFKYASSVRGHFCYPVSEHDKPESEPEISFPSGGTGNPLCLTLHFAGGEAETRSCPGLWMVIHTVSMGWVGVGKLSHHFICYSTECIEDKKKKKKEIISTPFNLFLLFRFMS